ncbi:MFS transporter [Pseudonocardia sp. C8]|uniref:MFS transporter n=1 Tax=Pseudonocardia sp. C8 TaxID=2762759 RepID=UPI001643377B|nr:MFS transporter [Pseudonocardia sp. C8]MBC3192666.1 MFS transporter [Pseudonocardia sp. C8]
MTEGITHRAGRREWTGLAVLALPCLLYSMDLTVLYLAVPSLTADLAPTAAQLLWITDVYGFLLAGSLLTMGSVGDRIGRRRLLLIGAAAFGAASVVAALATQPLVLIGARALLGVAAGALAPSTLSLLRSLFPDPRQRSIAIGVWAASFSVGAALGPLAGGLLLEFFWWGSVFLLAVPVMALLLVLGPRLLPEHRDPHPGKVDLPSAGLSVATVLAAIAGLKIVAVGGNTAVAVGLLAAALLVGYVFIRRKQHLAHPLVELALFRDRAFGTAFAANLLSLAVLAGFELFVAQYLQLGFGLSPLLAGVWTVPSAGGLVAGAMLAPVLTRVLRPRTVLVAGFAVAAGGFAWFAVISAQPSLGAVVAASVVVAVGVAPVGTLGADLIVGTAPADRAGMASGISETGLELGGALGIAVLGSIGTAVYRRHAGGSGGTFGEAVERAGHLPGPAGRAALSAARDAFAAGMQVAAAVCLALCVATAVLVRVLLARSSGSAPVR